MKISWEVQSEDRLSIVSWKFYLINKTLLLDEYCEKSRETTRKRKWNIDKIYSRIGDTRLLPKSKRMEVGDVELSEDIKQKAMSILVQDINVSKRKI